MHTGTAIQMSALADILQSLGHDGPDKSNLACAILASALANATNVLAQHRPTLTPDDTIDTMSGVTPNDHARLKALTSNGCAVLATKARERNIHQMKRLRSKAEDIFVDAGVTPETAARLALELSM